MGTGCSGHRYRSDVARPCVADQINLLECPSRGENPHFQNVHAADCYLGNGIRLCYQSRFTAECCTNGKWLHQHGDRKALLTWGVVCARFARRLRSTGIWRRWAIFPNRYGRGYTLARNIPAAGACPIPVCRGRTPRDPRRRETPCNRAAGHFS